jgi:hypothetical protein
MLPCTAQIMNTFRFHVRTIIGSLIILTLLGCGGKQTTYRAGGKVKYGDGTPVTTGWVSFRSLNAEKENVVARGAIQTDGTFELTTFKPGDGAVEGRHRAMVMALNPRNERTGASGPPPPPLVSSRYSNYETSGLEFTVTDSPSQNRFEIVVAK